MSESVNTLSLGLSQGESRTSKRKASVIEDPDEPSEPKRYKISPRATLDASSELRISRDRVLIPETLDTTARGASASVQLAILLPPKEEDPEHPPAQGHFVALKQFRLDDDKGDTAGLAPLAHELNLLRNLEHKNIVRGLGFVENVGQGIAWIVLPWALNGNLRDFVRSKTALSKLDIQHRLALMKDVLCGLEYLHGQSEPICHGDLKSVLTGKLPFNDIVRDQDVVIGVLGGNFPKPQPAPAGKAEQWVSSVYIVRALCTLMEMCWAMDPQIRPKCGEVMARFPNRVSSGLSSGLSFGWSLPDPFPVDSLVFLQAVSEMHLSEGRLGEAIQYIQEFRRVAGPTKSKQAAVASQELLNRCRRSTSGVETVHEEEAGHSWNLALTFFASQLYREAERHVIDAARLYKELGLETQALECNQFLDAIQDAMGTLLRYSAGALATSYNKDLPRLLLTQPEKLSDPVSSLEDPIYESQKKRVEMVWLVAGALQSSSPDPLAAERIVSLIEEYHPGKVRQYRESQSVGSDTELIGYILSGLAFEEHETLSGYWRLSKLEHLPPFPRKDFLRGYFTPLGSPNFGGTLQCTPADSFAAEWIVSPIEQYHPGEGLMEHIVPEPKAPEARETPSGHWSFDKLDLNLSPFSQEDGLFDLLGSPYFTVPSARTVRPDSTVSQSKDLFIWPGEEDHVKIPISSDLLGHRARDEEVVDSLVFLLAMSEKHLSEGRLGEAIQYIQKFRRVARPTKRELTAITSQELLDRCRRSTSRVETVHEEEAGTSWNLALTFFAGQLYQEAEREVITAARLYKELGFEVQAMECDQFMDAIQDAMGTLLPYPEGALAIRCNKDLPRLLLTQPEKFRDPVPSLEDPIYESQKKRIEIVWFVA